MTLQRMGLGPVTCFGCALLLAFATIVYAISIAPQMDPSNESELTEESSSAAGAIPIATKPAQVRQRSTQGQSGAKIFFTGSPEVIERENEKVPVPGDIGQ